MSQPTVLVISSDFDDTIEPVVAAAQLRARVVRFDVADFPTSLRLTVDSFSGTRRIETRGQRVDLDEVTSVWYRRPTIVTLSHRIPPDEQHFAAGESYAALGGTLQSTAALWVNRPDRDIVAGYKPYQLALAQRLGLRRPRSVIGNSPREIRHLLSSTDVVYKLLGGPLPLPGHVPATVLTSVIDKTADVELDRIRSCPCLFQEYIPKRYEVRLTVIGPYVFPVTIDSQRDHSTAIDWRRQADGLRFGDFVAPPPEVLVSIRALMRELQLVYGAFDFIVTPDGSWVFLEVNPTGQFIWLADQLGLPMCERMADVLVAGSYRCCDATQVISY